MAGEDESLLDVFVNIAAKGLEETEKDIDDFVKRVRTAFGDAKALNVGTGIADGVKKNLRQAVDAVKEQAEKMKQSLRESLLKFGQEKDLLSIQVRLLGDDDIKRRLQDIQSQVSAATKTFHLAEPGEGGDAQRAAAIERINALRQQGLAILRDTTNEQIKQRGLDQVYQTQAESFLKATQNAQTFNQQLKELNRLVSSTRDSPLIAEFAKLKTEIERTQLALRQGLASGNLVDIDDATAQLNTLRLQFDRFRDDAEKAIVIRTNAQDIKANFDAMLARLQRDETRDASQTRGSAISGSQKVALSELKHEVAAVTFEFRRLSAQTDLTARDIQELSSLFSRLQTAASNIGEIRQQVISLGPQMNTLSNNAYQIGQAFEDAAVGFSLNGISGAVRGASNNITFLIQNIAQARAAQAQLTGETLSPLIASLPLYAAIGAAISLIVVGPLTEWIESLNDVEAKTRGIADLIERAFSDARFMVSLELDADSALRAIQDAKDAENAIAEIIRQAEDAERLRFKITAELDFVSQRKVFEQMEDSLRALQDAAAERLDQMRRLAEPGANPDVFVGIAADPAEKQAVENLAAALDVLRVASEQAFQQAQKGVVPRGELEAARDSVRLLQRDYEELVASGVLSADAAKELKKVLDAIHTPLEDAAEEAAKWEAAQKAILEDGLEALGMFEGLSNKYKFLDAVNEGRLQKEDKILFDLHEQNIELDKQAAKARELFGNNNPLIEGAIDNREGVLQDQHRIDITSEILEINEKIAKERKEAEKDEERFAKRRLELEKRIGEEKEKIEEKVAKTQKAINDALNAKELADQEDRIQKRINALQKADVQSKNFSLGDVGTIAFGPDTKTEVERLQQQLKDLRESANEAAHKERVQELRDSIVSDREESHKRIQEIQEDLNETRKEEIEALRGNAHEIEKLIEQIKILEGALRKNELGVPQFDENMNRNGPLFLPEGEQMKQMEEAQALANAAAMQNVDFKSSSIETLIGQSNRLLASMNMALQNQDLQPRLV